MEPVFSMNSKEGFETQNHDALASLQAGYMEYNQTMAGFRRCAKQPLSRINSLMDLKNYGYKNKERVPPCELHGNLIL